MPIIFAEEWIFPSCMVMIGFMLMTEPKTARVKGILPPFANSEDHQKRLHDDALADFLNFFDDCPGVIADIAKTDSGMNKANNPMVACLVS
jgi:hypothetical protein